MTEKDNDSSSKSHVLFEKIPAELRGRKQWVLWGWGNNEKGKRTKVPKTLGKRGIIAAKSNDPASWLSFEEAKAAYTENPETFAGVMMALTAEDPYVFIDLDNAVDSEGHIKFWAQEITDQFQSYAELSVSGTGVHIISRGKKDKKWMKSGHAKSKVCRTIYQDGEIEVHDQKRFVVFTGELLGPERLISNTQAGLDWLVENAFAAKAKRRWTIAASEFNQETLVESDDEILGHALAKDQKFRRLFSGDKSGYPSQSEADLALCAKISFWWKVPHTGDREVIDRIYRQGAFYKQGRDKWNRQDYRQATIEKSLEETTSRRSDYQSAKSVDYTIDIDPDQPLELNSELSVSQNLQKTDEHLAQVFCDLHGQNVLWCEKWRKWLVWSSQKWKTDHQLSVNLKARDVSSFFLKQAADAESDQDRKTLIEHARFATAHIRQTAFLHLAKTQLAVVPEDLDANPMLLNTLAGTVDLSTAELQPHNRQDLITKLTTASLENLAYEPVRWNSFLSEIFQDNTELIEFIQRSVGYAMTGEIRENVLFILHGDGANGKTTLIETVTNILGDYAKPAAPDLLLRKRSESHPTGVADLMGARFVSSVEADDGKKLDEALVKRLTGRDTIKARFMAQDFFQFEPSHKLFLAVNHKPEVEGRDQGIWRRIRLIPFEVEIPEDKQDTKLLDKLLEEGEAILAWAIRGCLAWQNNRLGLPVAVKEASQAYREESDVIGRFFDDCCILESGHQTQASVLYQAFRNWCERNGEKGYAANKFGGLIGKEKQLEKIRTRIDKKSCYVWKGIGVLSHLEHNQETSFESTTRTSNPVIDEILGIQLE